MSKYKLIYNATANYAGRLWSFISVIIFIPYYLKILGIEYFSIISFYSVLLGLLAFADLGLSATLNREFALEGSQNKKYLYRLLITFERLYLFIILIIITVFYVSSSYIAENYLASNTVPLEKMIYYIRIMAVILSLQLFSTLYTSSLMGLQEQVLSNSLVIFYGLFRSGLVILLIYIFPKPEVYFYWQLFCVIVFLLLTRYFLQKKIITKEKVSFDFSIIQKVWKYALSMMYMSLIGALNIQLDKVMVSKHLGLTSFGYYSMGTTFAQIPIMLASPIMLAVFPYISSLIKKGEKIKIESTFKESTFIISAISSAICVILFLYAEELIYIWTGDLTVSEKIKDVSRFLIIGSYFLSLQFAPYYLALSYAHTKTSIILGSLSVLFLVFTISYFLKNFNLIGASFPWIVSNFLGFILLSTIINNKFLKLPYVKFLYVHIFFPTLISIMVGLLYYGTQKNINQENLTLLHSFCIGILSIAFNFYIFKKKIISRKNIFEWN